MIAHAALALALALDDPQADPSGIPSPAPADCSRIDEAAASRILGFAVEPPEEGARLGGTCFYVARDLSESGTLSYTVVTPESLPSRRQYFRAYARRCAPAVKGTPNELLCRPFIALAQAADLDAYFAARTQSDDATPIAALGDHAVATAGGIYVKRGAAVYEFSVLRAGDFDLVRTTALARAFFDPARAS